MKDLVFIQNEQAITTSLKVAEVFQKNHQHVLRNIRDLSEQINLSKIGRVEKMFELSSYIDNKGESRPMYLMNRDGFSLLVMGFTGKKALKFKLDYIQAFNAMEKKLIELITERKSAEWLEVRKSTKHGYRKLTDTIQQVLIPLAREQGSTADEKFFYINYSKMLNKSAGVSPKSRDDLPVGQLYEMDKMQDMTVCSIKGLVAKGEHYKKIYSDTKQTVENYSQLSFINQRFLTA